MDNIKLIIAYLGTLTRDGKSQTLGPVRGNLEQALSQILQHDVKLQAASSTDAGVHAEGQVVNFFTPNNMRELPIATFVFSLNGLPP